MIGKGGNIPGRQINDGSMNDAMICDGFQYLASLSVVWRTMFRCREGMIWVLEWLLAFLNARQACCAVRYDWSEMDCVVACGVLLYLTSLLLACSGLDKWKTNDEAVDRFLQCLASFPAWRIRSGKAINRPDGISRNERWISIPASLLYGRQKKCHATAWHQVGGKRRVQSRSSFLE